MHFNPQTLTFLLLSPCGSVWEQKTLKCILPGSGEGPAAAEGCWGWCGDGEGELVLTCLFTQAFANHQVMDSFVTLLDLCLQRSSPTEQTFKPFAVFISTPFYQLLFQQLTVPWPVNEWVESDRSLYILNIREKKKNPKQDSEKGIFKRAFRVFKHRQM